MKRMLISLISLAVLLVPVNANAHAGVVATSPSEDQMLNEMPSSISITFSEELLLINGEDVNNVFLNLLDGPQVDLVDVKIAGNILSATIPEADYEPGVYEVTYRIVSSDGHKLSDSYIFSLNAPVRNENPTSVERGGDADFPLPIAGAILILVILGGFLALRAYNRKA